MFRYSMSDSGFVKKHLSVSIFKKVLPVCSAFPNNQGFEVKEPMFSMG